MSHFYGVLKGQRGEATRAGNKSSGLTTTAASWAGAIEVRLHVDALGRDCYEVVQTPWHGRGVAQTLARGVLGEVNQFSPYDTPRELREFIQGE